MNFWNPEDCLILVVDDIRENLQLIGEILEGVGYGTTFATNAAQALERLEKATPDLILLDLMMPQISGLELCEKIKAEQHLTDIPIIFLTASEQETHLLDAFEKGAVDYINKPFKIPELLARVKIHLELRATQLKLKKLVKEQSILMQELKKLATTDPLTGIWNRRHLFDLAEQEFAKASKEKFPFSVLMIDIDYFKKINDSYGHKIGDEAIKVTAKTLLKYLAKQALLGRFGGEEFVAFLPEINLEEAYTIAENLRKNVENLSLKHDNHIIKITLSIGVATYNQIDSTIDSMLQRADQALYQAKYDGRNKVVSI